MERIEFLFNALNATRHPNVLDVGANPLDKPPYSDLVDELVEQEIKGQNKILHPVVDRVTFANSLAKRMVGRTGVLAQNKNELRALSSSELEQLADRARDELRNHLRAFEG